MGWHLRSARRDGSGRRARARSTATRRHGSRRSSEGFATCRGARCRQPLTEPIRKARPPSPGDYAATISRAGEGIWTGFKSSSISHQVEHPADAGRKDPLPPPAVPCVLDLDLFINDVLTRHPIDRRGCRAWQAAAERYPQVVSLDDPMLDLMMAPATIGAPDTAFAYVIQGRQKIPWHGKRQLRAKSPSTRAGRCFRTWRTPG